MKQSHSKTILMALIAVGVLAVLAYGFQNWMTRDTSGLPYDGSNAIVYDNDEAVDMYTDEYLLALASVGEIQLNGMITSSPIAPYDPYVTQANYERDLTDREQLVASAKASGFANLPDRFQGPMGNLQKPDSGRIEDTPPIGAPGSRFIVAEARKANPGKPLVIVAGAPLTAEADAYLLDPSIADKVVVAWLGGQKKNMCDYNGWADPWAAYIVLQKLRLIQFPLGVSPPSVPKTKLLGLHASPLREYMYHKHHPTNADPGEIDGDGPPAISVVRRDYPTVVRHVSFSGWIPCRLHPATGLSDEHHVPAFRPAFTANASVVEESSPSVSTSEWWRAVGKALSH